MKHTHCPTRGAKAASFTANCEYCGAEFSRTTQMTAQQCMKCLTDRIATVRAQKVPRRKGWIYSVEDMQAGTEHMSRIGDAVNDLPLPSDIECLMEFFMLCHGNAIQKGTYRSLEENAWDAKAQTAYARLRFSSLNNPQLSSFLDGFKVTPRTPPDGIAGTMALGIKDVFKVFFGNK